MALRRLARHELKSEYQTLEPVLKRYCSEYPEYDMHKMLKEVLVGDSVMWAGENSFLIGGPLDYHNESVFLLEIAAGDLEEIMDAWPIVESDIIAWGFKKVEICGRLGWKKMMQPHGFELNRVVLKKTIGE